MIGGVTKFGGRARDAEALVAHLGKEQPGGAVYVAGPTTAAADMAGLVAEARLLAAARGVQARPFLHLHLSPSSSLDRAALMRAAEIVLRELGVTDQSWAVEIHGKDRRTGTGELHAHIVVGRAGASGSLLRSGFEKIRVETAVRIAEFEVGDRHVLGRHHSASVRHLEKTGRHDVVASLRAAHGETPPRPQGLSAEKRMKADRRGVDIVAQREMVRAAWSRSDDGRSFAAVLAEDGLELRQGEKRGVWIVAIGDVEIGSVDRLVGEDAEPSRPGFEASSQAQSKSATTSSRAETILRQTSQIGHLSIEARQRLIGIEGSLKALAGEDGEIEENPVIEALDLIVQMLAAQSQRLDRMEDTLEHLVQVVSADGSSRR